MKIRSKVPLEIEKLLKKLAKLIDRYIIINYEGVRRRKRERDSCEMNGRKGEGLGLITKE